MSSYRPPFARMRNIKRDNSPKKFRDPLPENVEEALEEAAAKQEAGEPVADEIRVPVGAVDAVIKPGPDKKFGTDDDEVTIEGRQPEPEPVVDEDPAPDEPLVVPEADEPEPEAKPDYGMDWKKADLVALADKLGVASDGNKSDIVAALDEHYDQD